MCKQFELKLPANRITQYGFYFIVVVLTGHNIELSNTTMLDKASGYTDCLIKEDTEIRIHPRNLNKERGFNLWVLVPSD
jgi:hypothetical protein